MIDFTQAKNIKDITIDGKELRMLFRRRASLSNVVWKKMPEYPYMTMALIPPAPPTVTDTDGYRASFTHGFSDKNGLLVPYWKPDETLANGVIDVPAEYQYGMRGNVAYYLYNSVEAEKMFWYDGEYPDYGSDYIYFGDTLMALGVNNDSEYYNFPALVSRKVHNSGTALTWGTPTKDELMDWIVPDAEWFLSDEDTGQIHLYAIPEFEVVETLSDGRIIYREPSGCAALEIVAAQAIDTDASNNDDIFVLRSGGNYKGREFWPTAYYKLPIYETSVTVKAGSPIVTLSSKTGGITEITSIRSNFDDYKVKYEAATGGKFSKTEYPYLRGIVKLDCKSTSLGINNTGGIYLIFSVSR